MQVVRHFLHGDEAVSVGVERERAYRPRTRIEDVLRSMDEFGGEFRLVLERETGQMDRLTVQAEVLSSAFASREFDASALELVREMVWQGLAPNVISYNAAISACEKGQQWEKGLERAGDGLARTGTRCDQLQCCHQRM